MKKKTLLLICAIVLFFGGSFLLKMLVNRYAGIDSKPTSAAEGETGVNRVVSLAPSITETVYLIGAEEKLIGNTIHCTYPPEAKEVEKIGGYATPDFEKIAFLKPDLVIMLDEHQRAHLQKKFDKLTIETLYVSADTVDDILDSIQTIGRELGEPERAEEIVDKRSVQIQHIRKAVDEPRPVVLVSVGKNMGTAGVESAFIAGRDTYYNDLIEIAGGTNGCPVSKNEYVNMSGESLLMNEPDIIIDIAPGLEKGQIERVRNIWHRIPGFNARIAVLTAEYEARPGPSFIRTLEDIHREIRAWHRSTQ